MRIKARCSAMFARSIDVGSLRQGCSHEPARLWRAAIDFFALGGFCKDRYAIERLRQIPNNGEMRDSLPRDVVAEFADPQLGDERCVPR